MPAGSNACLDGSTSWDPEDGIPVSTYAWVQVKAAGEPDVPLTNPSTSGPCFDTPEFVGTGGLDLHYQLTVTDTTSASNSAPVLVHVNYKNHPPTANAGSPQTVDEDTTVSLSGSGSDPDGNDVKFAWSCVSDPAITIIPDQADPTKATFTAPKVLCDGGTVVMRLTVDDPYDGEATSDVIITVTNVNSLPTASAGVNQQVHEGDLVELHGTGGDDDTEEVASLAFQWTQTSGTNLGLLSSGKDLSFTAPSIGGGDPNAFVELGFSLTVMDSCQGSTTTQPIIVHVANIPHAPVAVAQPLTQSANEGGSTVMLDGSSSSDPDLDPITYVWTQVLQPDDPTVTLIYGPGDTTSHIMPSFITPWVSANTTLTFKLTVTDFYGLTNSACVTVTINNWNQPPDVSGAHADVPVLWPPDHKMIQLHILGVTDAQSNATITITKVTQDEPTNGLGDGDTPIDAIISGDSVLLRSERSGKGNGRVYWVYFTASDPETIALNNSPTGIIKVMVPHDKKTDIAIDSGQNYDSTH